MAESNQKSSDGFKLNCTMRPSNNQDDANAVLIPIEACVKELKDGRWFTSGNHGQPGIISKVKMSKTGKHGHAKFTFNVAYPFTGQNSQEMHPGHSHLTKPEVMKKEYQVTNYEDGSIECMGTGDEGEQFFSYPLEYDGSAGGPTGKNFKIMWDEVYNLDEEMDLWVQVLKAPIKKKSGAEWCFQVTSAQYKPGDKSTGKVQNIQIKSSGGLSDQDIDRMVQEAEAAAENDLAAKKVIDLKNEADQFVYNTEKQLQEHNAKIPQNIKDQVRGDISSVNEAIVSENADKISEALERLKNTSMEIGKSIYANNDGDSNENQDSQEEPKKEENEEEKKDEDKKEDEKKDEKK